MSGLTDRLRTAAARDASLSDGDGAQHGRRSGTGDLMTRRARYLAPWIVTVVFVAGSATNLWLNNRSGVFLGDIGEALTLGAALLGFAVLGSVVIAREPRNGLGWTLAAIGVVGGLFPLPEAYATYVLVTTGEVTSAVTFGAWWNSWYWFLLLGLVFVLVPMLYPTGRFLSRRWGWFALVPAVAMCSMMVLGAISPEVGLQEQDELRSMGISPIVFDNPIGIGVDDVEESPIGSFSFGAFLLGMLGSVVSLGVRYKRSRGEERLQMKWFAFVAALMPVMMLTEDVPVIGTFVGVVGWVGFPAAIAVAILKYRLYDIDVVISRTLVFGGLAAFITAIYVGIVVGIGSLLGAGGEPNLVLSIVATAVVAVAFQPVRERLTRLANRLVFGRRATPYEVLSRFSEHLGEVAAPERTLERMAKLLADGTGAARAQVWLRIGGELRPAATWPAHMTDDAEPDHRVEVIHEGQLLGALSLDKQRGETLTPTDQKLVDDLAAQAGLVLRNLRLTEELKAKITDLQASRQRLVAAQDAERRRLERDLRDGAQRQLLELKSRLTVAGSTAAVEQADKAAQMLEQVTADADDAVATLRELAHGIFPPLLAAEGLAGALTAQAAKAAVPVVVEPDGIGRYPQDVEAAVYFCVLEAINNAAKYANPSQVTVRLAQHDGHLTFEVSDDGAGFDPATTTKGHGTTNMTDRLDAIDGALDITSSLADGTTVTGLVPVARVREVVQ